jgi:hypothetical protein
MALFKRVKIVPKKGALPPSKTLTPAEQRRLAVIDVALKVLTRRWFDDTLSVEANRILPGLLLKIFESELLGVEISKREACEPLRIDPTKTGARYIAMAEEHGFLTIQHKGSKDVLRLTSLARDMLDKEVSSLGDFFPPSLVSAGGEAMTELAQSHAVQQPHERAVGSRGCGTCKGKGFVHCPSCGGRGRQSSIGSPSLSCIVCAGSGKLTCGACAGSGTLH